MSRAQERIAVQDAHERERDQDVQQSHAKAKERGERILQLTNRLLRELTANGLPVFHADDVRVAFFSVLADDLYGGAAIDVPTLRGGR